MSHSRRVLFTVAALRVLSARDASRWVPGDHIIPSLYVTEGKHGVIYGVSSASLSSIVFPPSLAFVLPLPHRSHFMKRSSSSTRRSVLAHSYWNQSIRVKGLRCFISYALFTLGQARVLRCHSQQTVRALAATICYP